MSDIYSTKYIIITPVRNEELNIEYTIKSVVSQTIKPTRWIIVDDGSSDNTPAIIEKNIRDDNWISLIRLEDRGYYDLTSGGEIKAFYKGYNKICEEYYDFLVKLDGDISFGEQYFELLFIEFQKNKKLGIASGRLHHKAKKLIPESSYIKHPRGGARVYRRKCWEDIGGVKDRLSWDAIDVYKARMLGWDTFHFEKINAIHHVKTGTKGGIFNGLIRAGREHYLMGSHWLFFTVKVIKNIFSKPYLIGACATIYGYMKAFISREERVAENELIKYIRKEQLKRLLIFK